MSYRADAAHYGLAPDQAGGAPDHARRVAWRIADGFAAMGAVTMAGAVIANIFFLQTAPLRTVEGDVTRVSVESRARSAAPPPSAPAMPQAAAKAPPAAPAAAPPSAPAMPAEMAAAPPASIDAALVPPANLPVPKVPSPLVLDVQRELARRGLYDGALDGLTGPRTEAAVRAFEQSARLRQTSGEPTDAVLAELRRAPVAAPLAVAARPPAPTSLNAAMSPQPLAPQSAAAPPAMARAPLPPAGVPGEPNVTGSLRPPGDLQPSSRILAVQKALARLGYGPIKIDGQPGTETRQAIQRFERDRNLPATGEITDRMVRELAAVSGTSIE